MWMSRTHSWTGNPGLGEEHTFCLPGCIWVHVDAEDNGNSYAVTTLQVVLLCLTQVGHVLGWNKVYPAPSPRPGRLTVQVTRDC